MDVIRLLVQNLIVIIALAVFLEMLLPAGEMKRYVKLVMGLLVIVAVLNALGDLSRGNWAEELPDGAVGSEQPGVVSLSEIMASGRKISQEQQTKALTEYRRSLARQVSALIGMNKDVVVLAAEVEVHTQEGDPKFGQVKEIRLVVKNAHDSGREQGSGPVAVKIQVGEEKGGGGGPEQQSQAQALPAEIRNRLQTTIANFYNLSPEQVQVIEEGRN